MLSAGPVLKRVRSYLPLVLAACLVRPAAAEGPAPAPTLGDRQRVVQVLNRLTWGARPEDYGRVRKMGVKAFIEQQLQPDNIDDSPCDGALRRYEDLRLPSHELFKKYARPKLRRRFFGLFPASMSMKGPKPNDLVEEMAEAKLTRILRSERQLEEIMVDFWFNHFNVFAYKGSIAWTLPSYEEEIIRPHALGKFRDLLGAVAKSPAMLVYLDNAESTVDPRYAPRDMQDFIRATDEKMAQNKGGRKRLGLNENYARELMELHTLGVDGGYTQKDVIEVARVLTGWSVRSPNPRRMEQDFEFDFRMKMHDDGEKRILDKIFPPRRGVEEGGRVLDMLAGHPSTAQFIAAKLCRRFVCDDPPPELVKRVSQRFLETDGDIRETLRAIFESPEFFSPDYYRRKVKTPLEFAASALRATGAKVENPRETCQALNRMGEPLYLCEPPTGYPDRADAWVDSGALLDRMNLALRLFTAKPGAAAWVDLQPILGNVDPSEGEKILQSFYGAFLGGEVSDNTRKILADRLKDPEIARAKLDDAVKEFEVRKLAALVLGSPDFQKR